MRLLLDAHLSPAVAEALRRGGFDAVAIRDWLDGNYRSAADDQLLEMALSDERVLVTYDLQTIPPLLKEWAETGQRHGGVVLIDERTVRPNDFGGLVRALQALMASCGAQDWQDRVAFLGSSG